MESIIKSNTVPKCTLMIYYLNYLNREGQRITGNMRVLRCMKWEM